MVTGASGGLGQAMAARLADAGARLVLTARDPQRLERLGEALPGESLTVPADVRDPAAVSGVVAAAWNRFGVIDALVNNAGLMVGDIPLAETNAELWARILETNLSGAFYCAQAVLPEMRRRGAGTIINITSGAAVRTGFLNVPYGVSKAGLDRLTLAIAAEAHADGVHCVSLSPSVSATETVRQIYPEQNVDNWAAPPEETASAVLGLLTGGAAAYSGKVVSVREYLAADRTS